MAAALDAWGWRVALLLGAVIIPFGLVLRRSLAEALHRAAPDPAPAAARALVPTSLHRAWWGSP